MWRREHREPALPEATRSRGSHLVDDAQGEIREAAWVWRWPSGGEAHRSDPQGRPPPCPRSQHRCDDSVRGTQGLGGGGAIDRDHEGQDDADRELVIVSTNHTGVYLMSEATPRVLRSHRGARPQTALE